jgi:hypothetical protein
MSPCLLIVGYITVDVLKTKYMSDTAGRYASPMQCAVDAVREGGFRIFMKVCSILCLTCVVLEQVRLTF